MSDHPQDGQHPASTDSHAAAPDPSRKRTTSTTSNRRRKPLDVSAPLPLHVRPVLNGYAEVAAVGICSERSLRRHIATGRVKRSVIRNGRRLRFVKETLIEELLGAEE